MLFPLTSIYKHHFSQRREYELAA